MRKFGQLIRPTSSAKSEGKLSLPELTKGRKFLRKFIGFLARLLAANQVSNLAPLKPKLERQGDKAGLLRFRSIVFRASPKVQLRQGQQLKLNISALRNSSLGSILTCRNLLII